MTDVFVFADDDIVEEQVVDEESDSWKVLIVDDDDSVHQVTRLALKRVVLDDRPLEFISAWSGEEARQRCREHDDIALVLLDIVMETDNAGFEVANYIRHELNNHLTRIILRTGQPGDVPERDVILNYEIDGYKTKSELTSQALFSVILTSLRSYRDLHRVEENNRRLDYIVAATAKIYEQHTIDDFIGCLQEQLSGFIPFSSPATERSWIAADFEDGYPGFLAGSGSMVAEGGGELSEQLAPPVRSVLMEAAGKGRTVCRDGLLALAGRSRRGRSLLFCFDGVRALDSGLCHLLDLFSRNFETAFENLLLSLENENHRRNLEDRVRERTAQLSEARDRLFHAEKLASVGQLAAGVAHEINNPLGFIKSNIGMFATSFEQLLRLVDRYGRLETTALPESLEDLRAQIQATDLEYLREEVPLVISETEDGIGRIRAIISDLREFASIETGKMREVDLNGLLSATLAATPEGLSEGVEVQCNFGAIPPLTLMPEQLGHALANILVNAFEALEGGGILSLSTASQGGSVEILVRDNGKGIDEAGLRRIFDPFYTTKEVGQGTGLGLSLSYGVIKLHDGDISVDSEPGKGTTFVILLPVRAADSIDSSSL